MQINCERFVCLKYKWRWRRIAAIRHLDFLIEMLRTSRLTHFVLLLLQFVFCFLLLLRRNKIWITAVATVIRRGTSSSSSSNSNDPISMKMFIYLLSKINITNQLLFTSIELHATYLSIPYDFRWRVSSCTTLKLNRCTFRYINTGWWRDVIDFWWN